MFLQIAAWDHFRAVVSGATPTPPEHWENRWRGLRFFYSVGWTYGRQIQLFRLHEQLQQKIVKQGGGVAPAEAHEVWEAIDRNGAFIDNRGFRWTLESFVSEFPRTQISLNLARIACALERYRLAHGHLPERLEMLAPSLLAQLPENASDSEPLTYRITEDGNFVLTLMRRITSRRHSMQEQFQWKYPR
jgi:hypothetical protein